MEKTIQVLIYIHAFFGGIGLLTGMMIIFLKKAGQIHRKLGSLFNVAMTLSALISLVIALMPGHENTFLFLIGVFTIYLILAGRRALTLRAKIKTQADWKDKAISGSMLLTSGVMLVLGAFGLIQGVENSILYLFFGAFGAFMSWRDFQAFKVFTEKKNIWLINHLGRTIGAIIASVTAFLVAGLNIETTLVWMLPTILGTGYIIYWNRSLKKGKLSSAN